MLTLDLAVQIGHWHRDHRCVLLDLADACFSQFFEQWPPISQHVFFEADVGPDCQVRIGRDDHGEETLAVTPPYKAAEEALILA
ncbi:hypothetical protein D3C76_1466120 [compost metagenome]